METNIDGIAFDRPPTDAEILAAAHAYREAGTMSTKAWAERRVLSLRLQAADEIATKANERYEEARSRLHLLLTADSLKEGIVEMKAAVQQSVDEMATSGPK